MAERPEPAITDAMVEAKAIILFYQDEFDNLAWIAAQDACGNPATGDKLGRDMDRWENHPEPVKDRFRTRARAALTEIATADPDRETLKSRMEAKGATDG